MRNRRRLVSIFTWALIVLFLALILGISWIATCGIIYLITLCFKWTFTWRIATGIWLVLLLIVPLLKPSITVKK